MHRRDGWSKAMNTSSTFAEYISYSHPGLSKELSTDDMTHNFVVSYLYDLPFSRKLSQTSGPAYKALHGWKITGITRFTTDFPVTLQETDDRSLCGCDGQRLILCEACQLQRTAHTASQSAHQCHTPVLWHFAFFRDDLGCAGRCESAAFPRLGLNNWDMGLLKNTQITEWTSLQVPRGFFNVFNHAQFLNPVGNLIASNFGQVRLLAVPVLARYR